MEGLDQGFGVNLSSRSQCSYGVNIIHGESNMFTPPPSSTKKRKKKKTYWPKILDESKTNTKRTYKSMNTPKPSTPMQRKSYVRKRPSCMGPLFPEEDSVSLAFMEKKPSKVEEKVEESGSHNSLFKNELGINYNSLQTYQKSRSSLGFCLIKSRQVGVNFPRSCKKKRKVRERACLEKLLQPYKKGKRSKTLKRKRRCWNVLNVEGKIVVSRVMRSLIKKLKSLKKKREQKKETNKRKNNQVVVYKEHQIVPYKGPHTKYQGEVELDGETLRVWNLLLDGKAHIDHEKHKYWEEKRFMYQRKIEIFMTRMHDTLGDRRFLSWKGSVLDSVVGVFLTQNVSDYLSSGAFMNVAAKFPAKTTSYGSETIVDFDKEIEDNKVEVEDNKVSEFDKEIEDKKVEEVEAQNAKDSCEVDNKGAENNSSKVKIISDKKKLAEEEKDKVKKEKEVHWDMLRKIYTKSTRHSDHEDIVDWEAVRCSKLSEFAQIIKCRGQHNIIAAKIQRLLNHLKDTYGNLDLEWLRYAPSMDVKEYLLSIYGLGLKSVECIRLLALQHSAFPVDVNVGRIVVRLGWVPLKPLPESMQIHDLEKFPKEEDVQRYLWPRICNLDRRTLYQLHYQMITFGKVCICMDIILKNILAISTRKNILYYVQVFCGKGRPNCNACPMREEGCKYYESKLARYLLHFIPVFA
ncbi:putative DNA glycosylase, helix-turn-helix, base-excision DNA repair [Lupinus albus]|uniref:Putative DNA glycosylase, helix-turn-helix, base-excision DNA repair n=1 Tax=Lupinus albus TaxID=3870 RepID=A0A6A4NT84_LUPAL|nr:putative DNA glycosylase, helix-turn-helix, base-excision DNA repair [Lupinus albus]